MRRFPMEPRTSNTTHGQGHRVKLAFESRVALWFLLAESVATALAACSCLSLFRANNEVRWVEHTHVVINKLGAVAARLDEATHGAYGYDLTGERQFLDRFDRARSAIDIDLAVLHQLIADNHQQQERLTHVKT